MIIEVVPEIKTFFENQTFSYLVPEHLADLIRIGSVVQIPFGKKITRGVVKSICSKQAADGTVKYEIKTIKSVDINFLLPTIYMEIAEWVSNYYLCNLGEAISIFLPPQMKRPRTDNKQRMADKKPENDIVLNDEQKIVFNEIKKSLNSEFVKDKEIKPILLHGVTSSGKTELYIKASREIIDFGKQVIILVPEIMLTPQTVQRFEQVFGDKVALMHSGLSKSEKYNCYYDFYNGKKPIIIGPRSALLVPSEKIGLIIVDEEQEDSFKQEQNPRYHAVALAEQIAIKTGALLVLGSATPRIESLYKAKTGTYKLLKIKNRHNTNSLPSSKMVDLRNEVKLGNFSPISEALQEGISKTLAEKKQILLFLNRRGTATFVSCRDCGFISLCPNCSIPLVYYFNLRHQHLACHHCGHEETVPLSCPECQSYRIKFFGAGIDKIVSEIEKLFPKARIFKVDSTTINSKNDYENFYNKFKNNEVDIVIGTQMIAKGLDIPNVDLVGIISADTGLNMPHYKANEKTFQILTQVSGRSGRKENRGSTILQTYWPDALPIQSALNHDLNQFYENEIVQRENFNYPPFCKIVRIVSEHADKNKALAEIVKLEAILRQDNFIIIGPGACFYQKLHNKFRYHLMIKCDKIDKEIVDLWKKFPNLIWDVEPTNLL